MSSYWPTEDGWPYADVEGEEIDRSSDVDDDLMCLRAERPHLFDDLEPLERQVVTARFGLDEPVRSMKQLHYELGVPRTELRNALATGLDKLRRHLI